MDRASAPARRPSNSEMGYGHVYAPEHYIDAWIAVTAPEGWTDQEIPRLKRLFQQQRAPAVAAAMLEPVAQTREPPAGPAANPAFLSLDELAAGP